MSNLRKLKKPSEEFETAITHAGSIMINCQLCGRTHLGNDETAIEQSLGTKEYKSLQKEIKENPKGYILREEEMVPWGMIGGKQAVIGCPCNKLSLYENLFWNSRYIIEDYFLSRTEKELSEAKDNKSLAEKVKKSIK